jgi:hypothetical protein
MLTVLEVLGCFLLFLIIIDFIMLNIVVIHFIKWLGELEREIDRVWLGLGELGSKIGKKLKK